MRLRRLSVVVAITAALVLAGASTSTAAASWPSAGPTYLTTGNTGWSMNPTFTVFPAPEVTTAAGTGASIMVAEPWKDGGGVVHFQFKYYDQTHIGPSNPTQADTYGFNYKVSIVCRDSGGSDTYALSAPVQIFSGYYTPRGWGTVDVPGSFMPQCVAPRVPVGVMFEVHQQYWASGVAAYHLVQHMVWYSDASAPVVTDYLTCKNIFGPGYKETTTAVVGGVTKTAADYGCGSDYLDWSNGGTAFAVVCKDPPAAAWLSFDWLGPWVGFYADCLFNPKAGWDPRGVIGTAYNASPIKPLQDAVSGVSSQSLTGSCGDIVNTTLLGAPFRLSTCDAGWNLYGTPRTMVGVAFLVAGGVAALAIALAAFGFKPFGASKGGDDE